MGCIEGDMCYVHFEVLVWISVACITVQRERFSLGKERDVGNEIVKGWWCLGGWGGNM